MDLIKKYAAGNKDAGLKVISLGVGVQSSAVYLMSSIGYKLPRADIAVFADPGAEHEKTYKMLEWLMTWKDQNDGIEILVNDKKNLYKDIMNYNGSNRLAQIPQHVDPTGIVMRQCTYEYKILPVIETVRKIHNLKKHKRMKPTEMWLGISTDEIERLKQSKLYNIDYFYPLLYHGISRSDCIKFFNDHNFPVPPKSSCVFCPFHSNKFWKQLKKENGDAWKKSVAVDHKLRNKPGLDGDLYLHTSRKALDQIDFHSDQLEMFKGFDCEGHCGL